MNYVLDACAMIALLLQEPGEEVVWSCLLEKDATCFAHSMNLCEVFYDFYRDSGETAASEAIEDLRWLGIVERSDLDQTFWREAGTLKGTQRVSLADCCAITLTKRVAGTLLTSDHHEFDTLVKFGICPIKFIR
jgi:PIN domain nuclease of toxin-antitoxin system